MCPLHDRRGGIAVVVVVKLCRHRLTHAAVLEFLLICKSLLIICGFIYLFSAMLTLLLLVA